MQTGYENIPRCIRLLLIKDKLEDRAAALVRNELKLHGHDAATALLATILHEIATDWIAAYHKYVSSHP